ncbi:helix-turn-helix domain-containing protein [Aneurinibacillus migulanus]|uniref:Putative transcriptional regulator n=1 Tax=Aneurinibacillus migulanus TaxID=47500 RepID=A0A0D1Y170_ANEMI|nr:helix-turn-helix transcriptional regulator [Aneurinibacillus migulanus]KIV60276.1 hypothetical protein TS65_00370 [Aneurinibacillus migulanus]KON90525.1 hypothetical protein AF333_29035 [Aneurinibacillus migulanus]MED0894890.1 helix-turn-helix transcriptional regulator [Aneurinibacillus migulanus]MED1614466.1 helix-turn-helix transcriptional regulator [Aneurinibacillus migulanus]SDJ76951.1 putative transcriptional regulator [Aneurinibacillus migulanus]
MIKSNLPVLMAERLLKVKHLSEETGISRTTLFSLYYGKGKGVQFDTLDKLCQYFGCTIGELLEYREDVS